MTIMGVFDRFKRKPPKIRLKMTQVVRWLEVVMESKGMNRQSALFKEKIDENIKQLTIIIEELINASINSNPYILRLRKTFIKEINEYLELIKLPVESIQIAVYTKHIASTTENFLEQQQKIIFRLAEYFPVAKKIVIVLDSIDKETTNYINKINKNDFVKVIEARKLLQNYNTTKKKREELIEQINIFEKQKDEPIRRLAKIQRRLSELMSTNNYKAFKETKKEYDLISEQLKKVEQPLKNHFVALKTVLKKFKKDDLRENLIDNYLEKPIKTLILDQSFVIIIILKEIKEKITKFDFSETQIRRTNKHIEQITKGYLQQQILKIKKIRKKEEELDTQVKRNTTRMLVSEQNRQQELVQERLLVIEEKIGQLEAKKEPLSIRLAYQKLRDKLKEINERIELEDENES